MSLKLKINYNKNGMKAFLSLGYFVNVSLYHLWVSKAFDNWLLTTHPIQ